ncbi:NfeD family protein [Ectobacillus panaciterrae]|uniref:NfeD family protein n=1 Tax=Ectobacillus panaciterrae TaxID=363872 RepID=UPI00042397CD|nr:NfeD family protein [Ectobacillus panaciterrae]
MTLFGYALQTLYLYGLVITGLIAVVYFIFGDIVEGIFDGVAGSSHHLTLLFSFLAILCGGGYILEYVTAWNSIAIFVVAVLISFICVLLMQAFVLVPISRSEQNTAYRTNDFVGQTGEVLISVPAEGYGEVLLASKFGSNALPAKSYTQQPIAQGQFVRVIEIQDGVLVVEAVKHSVL